MDNAKVGNLSLIGGAFVLIVSALIRLGNISHLTALNIPGLWKLSIGLLFVSIAASLNKR